MLARLEFCLCEVTRLGRHSPSHRTHRQEPLRGLHDGQGCSSRSPSPAVRYHDFSAVDFARSLRVPCIRPRKRTGSRCGAGRKPAQNNTARTAVFRTSSVFFSTRSSGWCPGFFRLDDCVAAHRRGIFKGGNISGDFFPSLVRAPGPGMSGRIVHI